MKVVDFLAREALLPALRGASKSEVLAEMATWLAGQRSAPASLDARQLLRVLEEREQLATTAIGDGIAIPHAKLEGTERLVGALGRSVTGLAFDSLDGKPTHIVFMLVAPANSTGDHLKALARLSRLFRDADFRQRLLAAADGDSMYRIIVEEDAKF